MTAEAATAPRKVHLLNRWLVLFLFAMILANIGGNMYGPILPLYLQELNATVSQVGLFFTLSRVIPLALQIVGGYISDSLGRLRAIAIGSVASVFAYAALFLAPTWQWVLVSAAFSAITFSLIAPSFDAFIAEHSEEHNRARVFAISQTIFGIVAVVGPVLGGWLVDVRGYKFMILIAALFYLAATVIRIFMAREASKGTESKPKRLSYGGLKTNLGAMIALLTAGGVVTWILITDGVRDMSFNLSFDLLPIYMRDFFAMTTTQIGWVNSIFGLFMMLIMYPAGILSDKKGERVGISLGFFLMFVSISMLALLPARGFWAAAAGWAIAGTGVGLLTPPYQSLISKAVPRRLRGVAYGFFGTSVGLLSLPAPYIGAMLWDNYDPRLPFAITAVICLLTIIPVWLKFKIDKPVEDDEPLPEKTGREAE
jgi:MFS family permease